MSNTKNIIKKLAIVTSFLAIGFIFFCFYEQWIIISLPQNTGTFTSTAQQGYQKKSINLLYYKQEKMHKEQVELVIPTEPIEKLQTIINAWLLLLEEENIVDKKITADTVTIAPQTKVGIVSFNQNPFNNEQSAHEKLLFIEGLLTTIRQFDYGINAMHFLVQQETLKDYHLDFAQSWPLEGFLD